MSSCFPYIPVIVMTKKNEVYIFWIQKSILTQNKKPRHVDKLINSLKKTHNNQNQLEIKNIFELRSSFLDDLKVKKHLMATPRTK